MFKRKFKMVAAQGEMDASKSLREAAETIAQSSSALQLRYSAYRRPLYIYMQILSKTRYVYKQYYLTEVE